MDNKCGYFFISEHSLVVEVLKGFVHTSDYFKIKEAQIKDKNVLSAKNFLIDFRLNTNDFNFECMKNIYDKASELASFYSRYKSSILADTPLQTAQSILFNSFSDAKGKIFAVFSSMERALAFLFIDSAEKDFIEDKIADFIK
ncbi:MAG: hypothetical protein GX882_10480 [Methanomicrobiales archaeon]|nr:hypothetical protein [Methanomicrobiales archaeon]